MCAAWEMAVGVIRGYCQTPGDRIPVRSGDGGDKILKQGLGIDHWYIPTGNLVPHCKVSPSLWGDSNHLQGLNQVKVQYP